MVGRFLTTTGAIVLLLAWPAAASVDDPLWHRAVSIAAANQQWIPGRAVVMTTRRGLSGKVESRIETWVRFKVTNGAIQSEIVQRLENGRKLSRPERAEQNRRDTERRDREVFQLGETPFSPQFQSRLEGRRLYEQIVEGKQAIAFWFALEKSGQRVRGTAWLERESGTPLLIEFAPDPLPPLIRELRTTVRFMIDGEGRWLPRSVTFAGQAGVLWLRRSFDSVFNFTDFIQRH